MNKAELIEAITDRIDNDKKVASRAVEAVVDTITRAVAAGEKVAITGFGVFERQDRAARTARNPATGAAVKVKKTAVPKFRPGKGFKDVVSGAKKLPKIASSNSGRTTRKIAGAEGKAAGAPAKSTRGRTTTTAAAKSAAPAGSRTRRTVGAGTTTASTSKADSKAPSKAPSKATSKTSSRAAGSGAASKSTAGKSATKAPATKATATKSATKSATKATATKATVTRAAKVLGAQSAQSTPGRSTGPTARKSPRKS